MAGKVYIDIVHLLMQYSLVENNINDAAELTGWEKENNRMGKQNNIDFASYLMDDKEKGIYRADRKVFTDPELFELEMKYILKKTGCIYVMKAK